MYVISTPIASSQNHSQNVNEVLLICSLGPVKDFACVSFTPDNLNCFGVSSP